MIKAKKNGAPRQESAAQVIAPTETNSSGVGRLSVNTPLVVVPAVLLHELIEREVSRRVKDVAVAWSNGLDWSKVASTPSHVELRRRRYDYGPLRPPMDREAMARWVRTGSSEEVAA